MESVSPITLATFGIRGSKTDVAVALGRVVEAAMSRPDVPGIVVPRAGTQDTLQIPSLS